MRWVFAAACGALLATGCGHDCELEQCDIRTGACQQAVLQMTLCIRGGEPVEVPVEVVDADAYADEQVAAIESDEETERTLRRYRGLALLRLVSDELTPVGAARSRIDRTGAFYSTEQKRITILDRGRPLDDFSAAMTLVHEYVHALQDEEHDIESLYAGREQSADASLAVSAMIEGEAVLYQAHASAAALGYPREDVDFMRAFDTYGGRSRKGLSESTNPWIELYTYFAYAYGASYLDAADREGGRSAVAELVEAPPLSSRQVIAGYGSAPPGGEPWVEQTLDEQGVPALDASFENLFWTSAGSYALWAFLERWSDEAIGGPTRFEPIQQLRRDVLSLHDREDGTVLAAWRLRFSEAQYAEDFIERLQPNFDTAGAVERRSWAEGRDVYILATSGARDARPELSGLDWTAVPEPMAEPASGEPSPLTVHAVRP